MDAAEIARRRLASTGLAGRRRGGVEEVVGHLGAVQAQDYPNAAWSVAQRATGVTEADVDRALAEGRIIRTHILRPTWHFVLPSDIHPFLVATGERVLARTAARRTELGLDGRSVARAIAAFERALRGRATLTRRELADVLRRTRIDPGRQRLPHLLMHAELEGVLGSGGLREGEQTYALLEERAPRPARIDRDDAVRDLVLRYVASHGPATVRDLVWWSSLGTREVRDALEDGPARAFDAEGRTYWWIPDARRPSSRGPQVDLVQVYDEVVVAYQESRDVLTSSSLVGPRPGFVHFVLLDGRGVGRWRRRRVKDRVAVDILPSDGGLATEAEALARATRRYARFSAAAVAFEVLGEAGSGVG